MNETTDKILEIDQYLQPYKSDIDLRISRYKKIRNLLLTSCKNLSSFANGHLYFGFHRQKNGWYYREWAPNAQEIALIGDFNNWNRISHKLNKISDDVWEIFIPGADTLPHGSKVKIEIKADGQSFDRIPLYCKRAVQDPSTYNFDGQIWYPDHPFTWTDNTFDIKKATPLLIYESHIGMSGEKEGITTFQEYTDFVLLRVKKLGYNAIQLMGIMEHPYYGSFGYQVSNFFAVSSRFGTPEDLKNLINTAHNMGIAVFLDLIHSHAACNVLEGIGKFDGTEYQFFHSGEKGNHPAWGTKLFNYGKQEVIHFLLSNIKFWLEEYHFDGFRFDGVTSMLYHDHGLNGTFDSYSKYFSPNTDTEAVTYLQLAAELCKEINPDYVLIAEEMSGMPGMCLPVSYGGIGFDYRLGMGIPDFWVRTLRDEKDENWNLGLLWHELTQRRPKEKVIGYCESHDQAIVGDKTIMFWLADQEMYWHMSNNSNSHIIDRAMALHKMIRLITCSCAGDGYLNFMGNEFGHPEWIDFPRQENNWSYQYARRKWSLADDENMRYKYLQNFDSAMIQLVKENNLFGKVTELLLHDEEHKILVFLKGEYLFAFNFHLSKDYLANIAVKSQTNYRMIMNSDWAIFGGQLESDNLTTFTSKISKQSSYLEIPIANRVAIVCKLIINY